MFNQPNHVLQYRPLISGVAVFNPLNGVTGTLGIILTDGIGRWILSAHHVLGRAVGAASHGEAIFQPYGVLGSDAPVATLDLPRSDPTQDFALAQVGPGVTCDPWILGIGRPSPAVPAAVGMTVLKSGIRTGVTQGRVASVLGPSIVIETEPAFPSKYDLTSIGDSGSVWVEAATRAPVALHLRGQEGLVEAAFGVEIASILNGRGLSVLT